MESSSWCRGISIRDITYCEQCKDDHDWSTYDIYHHKMTESCFRCQPPLEVLHFGPFHISRLYRAWLYWNAPYFSSWDVVTCASDQCNYKEIADPWGNPQCNRDIKRDRCVAFLVELVCSKSIFEDEHLRSILDILGVLETGDTVQADEGDTVHDDKCDILANRLLRAVGAGNLLDRGRLMRITRKLRNITLSECESVVTSGLVESLATRAFLLHRFCRDALSCRRWVLEDLVHILSNEILDALYSALESQSTHNRSLGVLGWAHEILSNVMMSNVMDEYMVITRPRVDGKVFMPTAAQKLWRTSDVKDVEESKSTRGKKVLHDVMFLDNEALVYNVRRGNMRVCITKFEVEPTSFFKTFMEEYGSRDGCVLHNGFAEPTNFSTNEWVRDGSLVVYIEGHCV